MFAVECYYPPSIVTSKLCSALDTPLLRVSVKVVPEGLMSCENGWAAWNVYILQRGQTQKSTQPQKISSHAYTLLWVRCRYLFRHNYTYVSVLGPNYTRHVSIHCLRSATVLTNAHLHSSTCSLLRRSTKRINATL